MQSSSADSAGPGGAGFRSGYVSLSGRPNVGKSTLLNRILGKKASIVSPRAQTTRNRVVGIRTWEDAQAVFLDTPGIYKPLHGLGAAMRKIALGAMKEVDVVLFMVEPRAPGDEDRRVTGYLRRAPAPAILVINKIDAVKKPALLPVIQAYSELHPFEAVHPLSAVTGEGVEALMEDVRGRLPEGPMYYPGEMYTDQPERFMVAEIIREKLILGTDEEVPHSLAVEIGSWQEREDGVIAIGATILVEKPGHKGIIIGKGGAGLKAVGSSARLECERLLGTRVYLELWVKVRRGWRSSASVLADLGF